ncbi:MAG TPA: Rrf2 family transcriptional regulator [Xanthobacteraceae bacterium]|jgi:Rrf2 family protein
MKLQVSTRIAILALLDLAAQPERQLSVSEIGDRYGVSSHHLAKVMHVLGRAGLVKSVRGVGGGYLFNGNTRRTTLLDVIQLFEEWGSSDGHSAIDLRTDEGRALREVLAELDDITQATLGSITIGTMLKLADRRKGKAKQVASDER